MYTIGVIHSCLWSLVGGCGAVRAASRSIPSVVVMGTVRRPGRVGADNEVTEPITFVAPQPSFSRSRRRRPTMRGLVWLGVSAVFTCKCLCTWAEAFVPTSVKVADGLEMYHGRRKMARGACAMNERRGLWPQKPKIDLRSDTVTVPTGGMRKAMHKAEVGDDVFGEDPTVKKLEAETAKVLGKEAALFVPSGTMANLICHMVWCSQRGSEMILGDQSHTFLWEQANAAQFGGIGYRPIQNLPDGTMDLKAVEAAVRGNNPCFPVSRLVTVENTHAQRGGKVLPIEYLDALAKLAQEEGLRVHMDGARLWNAAAASRLPASRIVADVDSVSVCFSKGLGAPVGSAVAGTADFVSRAMRVRKALGGGMRQSGVIAAAALEGLRKQLPRIGEDHANARRLAQGLRDLGMPNALGVDPAEIETNIVMVTVGPDLTSVGLSAPVVCDRLREKGLLAISVLPRVVRFVTHSQVSATDVQRAVGLVKEVLEEVGLKPMATDRRAQPSPSAEVSSQFRQQVPPAKNTSRPVFRWRAANQDGLSQEVHEGETGGKQSRDATTQSYPAFQEEMPATAAAETETVVAFAGQSSSAGGEAEAIGVNEVSASAEVEASAGGGKEKEEGKEEEDDAMPFREDFEEVELQGMTVSNEGFVAIMTSKESPRALKLLITPDDPMSGGLDVEQAETSEAITLLQLMQGIDVARHLPHDALGTLMDLSMGSGVKLSTVFVSSAKPFSATLLAKVPQRDSDLDAPMPAAPSSTQSDANAFADAAGTPNHAPASTPEASTLADDAWTDDGTAAAAEAAAALDGVAQVDEIPRETPVSPSIPGTTMGTGFGRPRLGVSKIAETTSTFEALGLALRYPTSKIFVRAELLAAGGGSSGDPSSRSSFDSADVKELYPNLMKLMDARARRSAADQIDAQFEVQKLRQQLESAVNAGDSDRISALRQELSSLIVANTDSAPVR
ncbi:unnamed protein product [Ascophyllum nodosum]